MASAALCRVKEQVTVRILNFYNYYIFRSVHYSPISLITTNKCTQIATNSQQYTKKHTTLLYVSGVADPSSGSTLIVVA
jgi:hypothetical protein